jgi:DNA-binding MarR family transcriptional regulator
MTEPRWLNEEEQHTWRAFQAATHLLFDRLDRELQRDAGIPHAYFGILVPLSEAPGRTMRMSDLAAVTLSSRSRLSHAVASMEKSGWVTRTTCPSDKRGQNAHLTAAGLEKLHQAAGGHVEGVRTHLFDLLSGEQLTALRGISETVAEHLTAE